MLRTRIKICGITRLDDAWIAADAGVDALGFVFVPKSSRYITPEAAQDIIKQLPAYLEVVGLVMNPDADFFSDCFAKANIDCWQFHGQESADDIAQLLSAQSPDYPYCKKYTKAIAAGHRAGAEVIADMQQFPEAAGLLIDGHRVGAMGGSGQAADWQALHQQLAQADRSLRQRLILAGGIDAGNCDQALTTIAPYAIDVSSGVESAPGIKCADKIRHLCDTVRRFDARQAASLSQ